MIVWDVKTGQSLRTFGQGHIYMPQAMAVSQDEKFAVTGAVADVPGVPRVPGRNDSVIVWDIEAGKELRRFDTAANIVSLAFDPRSGTDRGGGKRPYLAAFVQGNDVGLWNIETGDLVRLFKGHSGSARAIAFSPDGTALAAASRDKGLIFWDVETGNIIRQIEAVGNSGFIVFSPDGKIVATSKGPEIVVWDVATEKELSVLKGHQNGVASFAFSPDGKQALSGSLDNTFILWNLATQEAVHRYDAHDTVVWQVAFSPDQKAFLSAANGLILWRADPITLDEVKTWVNSNRYTPTNSENADNAG
jgi:WD40 repeat protein